MRLVKSTAALLPLALLALGTTSAWADDDERPAYGPVYAPPPPQPYPQQQPYPQGYAAPLSQTTQSTYVPQSVALSGPEEITDVEEGRRVPDGYTEVYRKRKGLIIGGGVTLGVSYGYSMLIAAIGEDVSGEGEQNEVGALWIPVAGPFVQMANTDSATLRVLLGGLGAAQLAGAVMLYSGLTSKKRVFVRNDLVGGLDFAPMAPTADNHFAQGMVVSGRF